MYPVPADKIPVWAAQVHLMHRSILYILQITKCELACLSGWMYCICVSLFALRVSFLAYITLDLNPASWAALVAQLAEHWTSNPVVTGSNPVRGSSVFFSLSAFGLCLALSCLPLHIHVQDLIMYDIKQVTMYMYVRVDVYM